MKKLLKLGTPKPELTLEKTTTKTVWECPNCNGFVSISKGILVKDKGPAREPDNERSRLKEKEKRKEISRHELSAFFRKPTHAKYKVLQNQILRHFLAGLQLRYRKDSPYNTDKK